MEIISDTGILTVTVILYIIDIVRLYCSRKLRRIRKSLHFTHGHRNRYQKRPITATIVTTVRYLYIPLICSERAWALAMELKQVQIIYTHITFVISCCCRLVTQSKERSIICYVDYIKLINMLKNC